MTRPIRMDCGRNRCLTALLFLGAPGLTKSGEVVRLLRSETLHFMHCSSGVKLEDGNANLTAIFSRIALTCSGAKTFRISAWPEVCSATPPLASAKSAKSNRASAVSSLLIVGTSQSRAVPSADAVSTRWPSALNCAEVRDCCRTVLKS